MNKTSRNLLLGLMSVVTLVVTVLASMQLFNDKPTTWDGFDIDDVKPDPNDSLSGEIYISGAYALFPLAEKWSAYFMKKHPKAKIHLTAGGAGKGLSDILSGESDLAMMSRPISEEETNSGIVHFTVARGAVVPTINANNPYLDQLKAKGIKYETLKDIWTEGKSVTWGDIIGTEDTIPVNMFTRSDLDAGAVDVWSRYLGISKDELAGDKFFSDPDLIFAIKADIYSIGFNNIGYVYDLKTGRKEEGLAVIPIDFNENGKVDEDEYFYERKMDLIYAVEHGKFPEPPARDLHFISNGNPTKQIVKEFLKFIMSGDGQGIADITNFISMNPTIIKENLRKLGEFEEDTEEGNTRK